MRVHFIAIGGSAMHNLAIALKENGAEVTGSDDEVFEPSRSRLKAHGLLPSHEGWDLNKITNNIDAVILGMHAREDNPELIKAQEIGLKVYSYPEYLYEQCINKKRVVIGGSHGKTTVTSMIMHALKYWDVDFDYMVGASLEGFNTMVRLSKTAKIAVFEGDEYLSSPIDLRPKFLWYKPEVALITGIAWDHINVFPSIDIYNNQFKLFIDSILPNGYLSWFSEDETLKNIVDKYTGSATCVAYSALNSSVVNDTTVINLLNKDFTVPVFGKHNLQNMSGAMNVCLQLGLSEHQFLEAMGTFKGASRRLQILGQKDEGIIFYDFAHAPSKLRATVMAVKERYPNKNLTACIELHTFSSLNANFLPQYHNTMQCANRAIVFYNPEVLKHKKLPAITPEQIALAFNIPVNDVISDSNRLKKELQSICLKNENLLLMTSGNMGGIDLKSLSDELIS